MYLSHCHLKLIKNYSRSTMGQERLNSLAAISILFQEKPLFHFSCMYLMGRLIDSCTAAPKVVKRCTSKKIFATITQTFRRQKNDLIKHIPENKKREYTTIPAYFEFLYYDYPHPSVFFGMKYRVTLEKLHDSNQQFHYFLTCWYSIAM